MIVCFGSINMDLVFELDHAPASGQTMLAKRLRLEAGGKGANQAVAAARDGARVVMVGAVGDDPMRPVALQALQACGADISRLKSTQRPTGCASILVDAQGRNQIVVASGANADACADQVDPPLLARAGLLLMQMECAPQAIQALLARAQACGVRVILNLAPAIELPAAVLRQCALLVVNEPEAQSVAGWLGCGDSARALHECLGVDVLRTLGAAGAEAATVEGDCFVPAYPVDVVDTTAAGDSFVGVLAAALDSGLPLPAAMRRASAAAALTCSRRGSQSSLPARAEIDALLDSRPPAPPPD